MKMMIEDLMSPKELIDYSTSNGKLTRNNIEFSGFYINVPEYNVNLRKANLEVNTNNNSRTAHMRVYNSDPDLIDIIGRNEYDQLEKIETLHKKCKGKIEEVLGEANYHGSLTGNPDTLIYEVDGDVLSVSVLLRARIRTPTFKERIEEFRNKLYRN